MSTLTRIFSHLLLGLTLVSFSCMAQSNTLTFEVPAFLDQLAPNKHAKINKSAYKQLEKIQSLVEQEQEQAALSALQKLVSNYQRNAYIVSLALQNAAYIYAETGQYEDAIKLLTRTLELKSLKPGTLQNIRHLKAQLHFQVEDYQATISALEQWMSLGKGKGKDKGKGKTNEASAQDYYLIALSWYQLKDCPQAIATSEKGLIQLKIADEALLKIQLNCALQEEDYQAASHTLTTLLTADPEKEAYWAQWTYTLLKLEKTGKALAAMETMAEQDMLTSETLRLRYIRLLIAQDNAVRAATTLEHYLNKNQLDKNLENIRLLAHAWQQAGNTNKAISSFEKSPSSLSHKDALKQFAQLLVEAEDWRKLAKNLEARLKTNTESWTSFSIDKESEWLLLQLGASYNSLGRKDKALSFFSALAENKNLSLESQGQIKKWLRYLEG
mgnify:FL=1